MVKYFRFLSVLLFGILFIVNTYAANNDTKKSTMNFIDSLTLVQTIDSLHKHFPNAEPTEMKKCVRQVASFWYETDGSKADFQKFCLENFVTDSTDKKRILEKFSRDMEIINGYCNTMSVELKEPLHMNMGDITPLDQLFGGWEPSSHLTDDFFQNKIAFYILLNFPCYTLEEKTAQGMNWSREKWAMVRMAETIKARIPGDLTLRAGEVLSQADSYISDYNIYMGNLLDKNHQRPFPSDMKLISHWGLRDELKANYNKPGGLEKQRLVYAVMQAYYQSRHTIPGNQFWKIHMGSGDKQIV